MRYICFLQQMALLAIALVLLGCPKSDDPQLRFNALTSTVAGDQVTLIATICNDSDTAISTRELWIWPDWDKSDAPTCSAQGAIKASVSVGPKQCVDHKSTPSAIPEGTHTAYALLGCDSGDMISPPEGSVETAEYSVSPKSTGTNLLIKQLSAVLDGETIVYTMEVCNGSDEAADVKGAFLFAWDKQTEPDCNKDTSPPAAQGVAFLLENIAPSACQTSQYSRKPLETDATDLFGVIDCASEKASEDNVAKFSLVQGADLKVESVSVTPISETSLKISAIACNEGPLPVTTSIGFYLDRALNPGGQPQNTSNPDANFGPFSIEKDGDCKSIEITHPLEENQPSEVFAFVDYENITPEINEDNNLARHAISSCAVSAEGKDVEVLVVKAVICLYNAYKNEDYQSEIAAFLDNNVVAKQVVSGYQFDEDELIMTPKNPEYDAFFTVNLTANDRELFDQSLTLALEVTSNDDEKAIAKPSPSNLPSHVIARPKTSTVVSAAAFASAASTCDSTATTPTEYYALGTAGVPLTPFKRGFARWLGPYQLWPDTVYDKHAENETIILQRIFRRYDWFQNATETTINQNLLSDLVAFLTNPEVHTVALSSHGMRGNPGLFGLGKFSGGIYVAAYEDSLWKEMNTVTKALKLTYGKENVTHQQIWDWQDKKPIAQWAILVNPGAVFDKHIVGPDDYRGMAWQIQCHAGAILKNFSPRFHVVAGSADKNIGLAGAEDINLIRRYTTKSDSLAPILSRSSLYITDIFNNWSNKEDLAESAVGGTASPGTLAKRVKAITDPNGERMLSWRVLKPESNVPKLEAYPKIHNIQLHAPVGEFGTHGKVTNGVRVEFSSLVNAVDFQIQYLDDGESPTSNSSKVVVNIPKACSETATVKWLDTYCVPGQTSGWQFDIEGVSLVHLPVSQSVCSHQDGFAETKQQIATHGDELEDHQNYLTIAIPRTLTAPNGSAFEGNSDGDFALDDYEEKTVLVTQQENPADDPDVVGDSFLPVVGQCVTQKWKHTTRPPLETSDPAGSAFRVHIPCLSACSTGTGGAFAPSSVNALSDSASAMAATSATCPPIGSPVKVGPVPFSFPVSQLSKFWRAGERLYFERFAKNIHELWSIDGTEDGAVNLLGLQNKAIDQWLPYAGNFYFNWKDELWRSNGTLAGTKQISIPTAKGRADPRGFAVVDGGLHFRHIARIPPPDGNPFNTKLGVAISRVDVDTVTGAESFSQVMDPFSEPRINAKGTIARLDDTYIFDADCDRDEAGCSKAGVELFRLQTTGAKNRIADIYPGGESSRALKTPIVLDEPGPLRKVTEDTIVFAAADSAETGLELWQTDGATVTKILAATGSESLNLNLEGAIVIPPTATASYQMFIVDQEAATLWRVTPTGSEVLFQSGEQGRFQTIGHLTSIGEEESQQIFFTQGKHLYGFRVAPLTQPRIVHSFARSIYGLAAGNGFLYINIAGALWISNGSQAGTVPIRTSWPGYSRVLISRLYPVDGNTFLFFVAEADSENWDLWRLDF